MDKAQFKRRLESDGITYILAQWVDLHGTPRCKGVPASAAEQLLAGSAGFAGAATVGLGQGPHDHDLIGMPDLASYTVVPWETGVARVACDIEVDGKAWPYCARTTLRNALARLAGLGYEMKVGVEAEHMLVSRAADGRVVAYDPGGVDTLAKPCYDFKSLSANLGYLRTLVSYMEALGWEPYATDHEDGTAQFELNWKYADALTTADRYTFFKMMTSQVATRMGAIATHMPKPFAQLTGNGSHVHFSLWKDGRNAFIDEGDRRSLGQSRLAYHFLGGLMAHARALAALVLGVHLDAGVHLVRGQQPHPHVPHPGAGTVRVPRRLRRREPLPGPRRHDRRGDRRYRAWDRSGRAAHRAQHVRPLPRGRPADGHPRHPAVAGGSDRRVRA